MEKMEFKSKMFLILFVIGMFSSASYAYYRVAYTASFKMVIHANCDPNEHSCFAVTTAIPCDPETQTCTGDPVKDTTYETSYYASLSKIARNVPACDPKEDSCQAQLFCHEGEKRCSLEYCDASNVPEGERCSDASDIVVPEEMDQTEDVPVSDEATDVPATEQSETVPSPETIPAPAAVVPTDAAATAPVAPVMTDVTTPVPAPSAVVPVAPQAATTPSAMPATSAPAAAPASLQ